VERSVYATSESERERIIAENLERMTAEPDRFLIRVEEYQPESQAEGGCPQAPSGSLGVSATSIRLVEGPFLGDGSHQEPRRQAPGRGYRGCRIFRFWALSGCCQPPST
jgi:hypothetical protein